MTITKARKKFEELKEQILDDGKVDITEAYVLLEFIEDYAKSGKKDFVDFKASLLKCTEDRVITDDESKLLVDEIEKISHFLKVEQIVEWVFFGAVAISIFALFMLA